MNDTERKIAAGMMHALDEGNLFELDAMPEMEGTWKAQIEHWSDNVRDGDLLLTDTETGREVRIHFDVRVVSDTLASTRA